MFLPPDFISEMQVLWQQYDCPGTLPAFLAAHDQPPAHGLRINGLKLSPDRFWTLIQGASAGVNPPAILPANTRVNQAPSAMAWPVVSWSGDGFYYPADFSPGRSVFYHAGLYYIQEPSAMLPAEVLAPRPGEKILDLCAAPGGKTARLAAALGDSGLLWANEISGQRVKALLRNVELMGIWRCVITQETPERLAGRLPGFFDRILVDAPCSGSGMFRRDPGAVNSWQKYGPAASTSLQREILTAADRLLRPGGILVYSTCSFSIAEDEAMVAWFIEQHPGYVVMPIQRLPGVSPGLACQPQMEQTARIWPHVTAGDGHFCARLQKQPESVSAAATSAESLARPSPAKREFPEKPNDAYSAKSRTRQAAGQPDLQTAVCTFLAWARLVLSETGWKRLQDRLADCSWRLHEDHLQLIPAILPDLAGLHLVKTGLYLGQIKAGRRGADAWSFEPAHAWLLTMTAADWQHALCLAPGSGTLQRYLRGETLDLAESAMAGWPAGTLVAVCLADYPLGWAQVTAQRQLKNLYPPGWRRLS